MKIPEWGNKCNERVRKIPKSKVLLIKIIFMHVRNFISRNNNTLTVYNFLFHNNEYYLASFP